MHDSIIWIVTVLVTLHLDGSARTLDDDDITCIVRVATAYIPQTLCFLATHMYKKCSA